MIAFLADEHVSSHLIRALKRSPQPVDIVTVQRLGLTSASDETILERGVVENRVVLTLDRNTMVGIWHAQRRIGRAVPGLVVINIANTSFGAIADDIILLANLATDEDFRNPIFVPLR